jgi:hypothetical protein
MHLSHSGINCPQVNGDPAAPLATLLPLTVQLQAIPIAAGKSVDDTLQHADCVVSTAGEHQPDVRVMVPMTNPPALTTTAQ